MGFELMQESDNKVLWAERWPAPAKLNLMLRITGRRQDGYHLLQTVFQLIDLCDWIKFSPAEDGRVFLRSPIPGVAEQDDLTIRAANLLKTYSGCDNGVCIDVEKNLPMGGGLGGGSSDAATTLVVLNRLWNLDLPLETLMSLGLQLGADVPVFVYGRTAWGEGVGEKLQAVEVPERWVVVIKPNCHVNTKEIFSDQELTRNSKSITIADFAAGDWRNDCQSLVSKLYNPVREALEALSVYADARLTGTGACVFAQFDSRQSALEAYAGLSSNWLVYMAKGMNKSPLYEKLGQGTV